MANYDLGNFSFDIPLNPSFQDSIPQAVAAFRGRTQSGQVGFFDWPTQPLEPLVAHIKAVAAELRQRCQGAVIFGIGGSFLGAAAIEQALVTAGTSTFPLYWVANSDPGVVAGARAFLTGRRCAAIVVSKSGNTTETLASFFETSSHFKSEDIVAITDEKSGELRRLVNEEKWKSFPVPHNIGGRFSVLTAVGLLPMALLGLSPEKMLEGARRVRTQLEGEGLKSAANYAAQLVYWDQEENRNIHVLMGYRDGLKRLTEWFVQLWGESIGKKRPDGKAVGFTPLSALGTSDQHSLLQLFKEGPQDKSIGFIEVVSDAHDVTVSQPRFNPGSLSLCVGKTFSQLTNEALNAVQESLRRTGMPTYRFRLTRLDESTLGAFFFFQMTACAIAGELYGVDAFNQPGVEEAKQLLKKALL